MRAFEDHPAEACRRAQERGNRKPDESKSEVVREAVDAWIEKHGA